MPLHRSQAIAAIRDFGRGRPNPTVPPLPTETVTIISVFPRPAFNVNNHFVSAEMPPCPRCETHDKAPCDHCDNYASLVVTARREAIDDPNVTDGSGRRLNVISAKDVAFSLIADNCEDRGVFVIQGGEPTKEELAEARERYRQWATRQVQEADGIWGQKRDAAWLNPLAHDAARYLGLTRDWMSDTNKKTDCEACGERVKVGVITCKCGWPISWQKAFDMGLLSAKQEKYGRKNNLFRDEEAEETQEDVAAQAVLEDPGEFLPGGVSRDRTTGKFQKSA